MRRLAALGFLAYSLVFGCLVVFFAPMLMAQAPSTFPVAMPAAQTIGAGGIIAADACGGVKRITAAGAVSTDTTDAITAPAASNAGCILFIVNVGSNNITVKHSAHSQTTTGADIVLAAKSVVIYVCDGTTWYQMAVFATNS